GGFARGDLRAPRPSVEAVINRPKEVTKMLSKASLRRLITTGLVLGVLAAATPAAGLAQNVGGGGGGPVGRTKWEAHSKRSTEKPGRVSRAVQARLCARGLGQARACLAPGWKVPFIAEQPERVFDRPRPLFRAAGQTKNVREAEQHLRVLVDGVGRGGEG